MKVLLFVVILQLFSTCKKESTDPPIDNNVDLDGNIIFDSSIAKPADFLLSYANPIPTANDLAKPVLICVHGFTACTYEWLDFRNWASTQPNILVSRVLLGGHGRTYEIFKSSNWTDWQNPIIEEYNRLRTLGYTNISLAGASTGCPLILEMVSNNKVNCSTINRIFLIDPIIVSSNKNLSLAPAVAGTVIDYTLTKLEPGENGHWYKYRPAHSLTELNSLILKERKALENGIHLPPNIHLKVYKSTKDESADPVSAVMLKKGVIGSEVVMINSALHVFTRLSGREHSSQADIALRDQTFQEMYNAMQR